MKRSVSVLLALLVCIVGLCPMALASEALPDEAGEAAEAAGADTAQTAVQPETNDEAAAQPAEAAEPADSAAEPVQAASEGSSSSVRWAYSVSLTALQSPYLTLVNADNLLEKDFEPAPLIKMNMVKRATSATVYLQEACAKALQEMFEDALQVTEYTYITLNSKGEEKEETAEFKNGMVLYLKSGYRSYGTQSTTYANYLARNNNVDDGYVAKPGASEHQSGLCADILNADYAGRDRMTQDFKYTAEAQWMLEHCAEYGFILRFPEDKEEETGIKYEPWHFRYVGKEVAGYIQSTGISFERFSKEWQAEVAEFEAKGGDVAAQLAYEDSRRNATPESFILDEYGEDGDAETSLVF